MQPVDLLAYYRDQTYKIGEKEKRDPESCRIALQLCKDASYTDSSALDANLFSTLKQDRWFNTGFSRLLGPVWLNYNMAHSSLGPFAYAEKIRWLSSSIAGIAKHHQTQLFGEHSSAANNQRQFKVAILLMCISIRQGISQARVASLPHLPNPSRPQA